MAATLGIATLETKVDLKGLNKGLDQAESKTKTGFTSMGQLAKGALATGVAAAAAAATAVVAEFVSDSIAEFQTFEKQAAEVFTLMPGMTEQAMGDMKDDVLAFSREVGRSSDEVLPALYQAISAGVPAENVFDFMKIASDAALGGVTDLETAVDGITSVVNAYGDEVIDAATASDVMFTAVKLGKTNFEQLSASLFNVVPTAASLGVTFEDVAANLAALTAQGTPTSVATTQLRAAFVEASKAGTKLDGALRDLTGKGFADLIADGQTSSQIFTELRKSMPEEDFRNLFSSVEASNAILGITNDTAAGIIETFGGVEDTLGATAAAAETMAQSLDHLQGKAEASNEALKIQAGEAMAPLKREWYELQISVGNYLGKDLELRNQLLVSSAALEEMGYSGVGLQKTLGALGEGTTFWRDSLVDAETMARRTDMAVRLLELGHSRVGDELLTSIQRIEAADNASNQHSQSLEQLNQMAAEQAATQEEANRAHQEWIEMGGGAVSAATDYSMSLDELRRMGAEAAQVQREELAVAEQEAAEAARIAAEETAELNRQSGALFQTLVDSEGPLGVYYQSLEDIAAGSSDLTVNQDALTAKMIEAAEAGGASASQMAILQVATGQLSAEQAEAIIKQVALEQTLARLGEQYANGSLTMGDYISAAQQAVRDINAMTVEFDTNTGAVNTSNEAIGTLIGTMGQIPSTIRTHISITSDPLTNLPGGGGGPGSGNGGGSPQAFATGGFTGWGPTDEAAGIVHRNELVVPAQTLRAGPAAILNFANQNVPGGVGSSPGTTINIDARGTDAPTVDRLRGIVRDELARSGRTADVRIRTG